MSFFSSAASAAALASSLRNLSNFANSLRDEALADVDVAELFEEEDSERGFPWLTVLLAGGAVLGALWLANNRREDIKGMAVARLLEGPAEGQSFAALRDNFIANGEAIVERFSRVADNDRNRAQLRHIIGIEKWGRGRLQSAVQHRPWVMDGHQEYKPDESKTLPELVEIFQDQRRRTVEFAQSLHEAPPTENDKIPHNSLGDLSVRAWLRYLDKHADIESRKVF